MIVVPGRALESIFCDDIRQEVGNKMTYVGVYGSSMEITPTAAQAQGVVVPKLCVILTARAPLNDTFKSLTFQILKDDDLLQEFSVPDDAFLTARDEQDETLPGSQAFAAHIVLSPLIVTSSFRLRVRALTESETLAAPALLVKYHEPSRES